jgi:hypothetical protein
MSWLSNAVKSPRGIADENQIFSHGQVQSRKPRRSRRGTSQPLDKEETASPLNFLTERNYTVLIQESLVASDIFNYFFKSL